MDSKEFISGVKYLAIIHPELAKKYGHFENEAMVSTWFMSFRQYTLEEFKTGLEEMVKSVKSYPTIAFLIDHVRAQYERNQDNKMKERRRVENLRILNPSPVPQVQRPMPNFIEGDKLSQSMKRLFEIVEKREEAHREEQRRRLHLVSTD